MFLYELWFIKLERNGSENWRHQNIIIRPTILRRKKCVASVGRWKANITKTHLDDSITTTSEKIFGSDETKLIIKRSRAHLQAIIKNCCFISRLILASLRSLIINDGEKYKKRPFIKISHCNDDEDFWFWIIRFLYFSRRFESKNCPGRLSFYKETEFVSHKKSK